MVVTQSVLEFSLPGPRFGAQYTSSFIKDVTITTNAASIGKGETSGFGGLLCELGYLYSDWGSSERNSAFQLLL